LLNIYHLYFRTVEKILFCDKFIITFIEELKVIHAAKQIAFCGNGCLYIWSDAEKLCRRLYTDQNKVVQVFNSPHAKQNLNEITGCIPKKA
jgi:hypothetical protein